MAGGKGVGGGSLIFQSDFLNKLFFWDCTKESLIFPVMLSGIGIFSSAKRD